MNVLLDRPDQCRAMGLNLIWFLIVLVGSSIPQSAWGDSEPVAERRYINGIYAPLSDPDRLKKLHDAARRDSRYVDVIKQSRDGFKGLNVEAAMESATDDTQMIDITDSGASIKIDGKAQMRAALEKGFTGQTYSASGQWIPEKSGGETWGIYKNVKVSYQYSTYIKPDGTEWTRPTIVVVEYKDGRRWREWRFFPDDR